jgi:ribulose 1,5-bisphosphate synthetase/thiazole synthase
LPTTNTSTTPYWATSATFPQFAKLAADVVTDIVVVGAGVTGLTAAYLLAKAGKRVVVLERDAVRSPTLDVPARTSPW